MKSRPRKARTVPLLYWGVVVAIVFTCAGIVLPAVAATAPGHPLSEVILSERTCRTVLHQAMPVLNHGVVASTTGSGVGTGPDAGRGVVSWLFTALTGVSLGQPASFLTADLPLAQSSYAPAIIASGRAAYHRASGSSGTGYPIGSPAVSTGGGAVGGGTSGGAGTPIGPPRTGEPAAGDGASGGGTAQLYRFGDSNPVVAIVHTHGLESYLPAVVALARAKDPRADTSRIESFTEDSSVNMLRVGEELARYLATAHGIGSIQSRRLHDRHADGFRLGAYERSLDTMTEILRLYPSVKVLLDLHRDAPGREHTTTTIGGVSMATVYVIVGTDRMLENPNWEKNYAFARRLVATMEQMYPGLSRGILVRDERYNQHVMERALLLEVGGQENTLEEVFASVRAIGEVLARIAAEGFE